MFKGLSQLFMGALLCAIVGCRISYDVITINEHYTPEPYVFLWFIVVVFVNKSVRHAIFGLLRNPGFLAVNLLIVILMLVSLLRGNSVAEVYPDARAQIGLVLACALIYQLRRRGIEIKWFLIGYFVTCISLDLLGDWLVPESTYGKTAMRTEMGYLACVGLAILAARSGSIILWLLGLLSAAAMVYFGVLRQHYLGIAATFPLGIALFFRLVSTGRPVKALVLAVLVGIIPVCGVVYFVPRVIEHMADDPHTYAHGVERTANLFDSLKRGNMNADKERSDSIAVIMENGLPLVIPYGLGWRANYDDTVIMRSNTRVLNSTRDSGYLYVAFHYGTILGVGILIMWTWCSLKMFYRSTKDRARVEIWISTVIFFLFLAIMLVSAEIFVAINKAIQAGFVIGMAFNLAEGSKDKSI